MILCPFHLHAYSSYSFVCIPPHLYALTSFLTYIHACLQIYFLPFYRYLIFPFVFPYVYVSVRECTRMYLRVHFYITYTLLVFVSCVYASFYTFPCICVWHNAWFVSFTISITTFVLKTKQRSENKYIYICIYSVAHDRLERYAFHKYTLLCLLMNTYPCPYASISLPLAPL
jgi:hypothetical protein